MKNLVLGFIVLFGVQVEASYTLPSDAKSLSAAGVTFVSQNPLCPAGAVCKTDGTVVKLNIALNGCLDEAAPVLTKAVEKGKTLHVYVSALNVARKASENVKCIVAPTKSVTLSFHDQYGTVKLHEMKLKSPIKIEAGDTHLQARGAIITKVKPLCPAGMVCITDGTVIELERKFMGCLDRSSDVMYQSLVDGSNLNFVSGSYQIVNEKSKAALCAQVMETKEITLINEFGTVVEQPLEMR